MWFLFDWIKVIKPHLMLVVKQGKVWSHDLGGAIVYCISSHDSCSTLKSSVMFSWGICICFVDSFIYQSIFPNIFKFGKCSIFFVYLSINSLLYLFLFLLLLSWTGQGANVHFPVILQMAWRMIWKIYGY